MPHESPSSAAVFAWPEFQAFARRLGIDLALPQTYLRIDFAIDDVVRVNQSFNGVDTLAADPPVIAPSSSPPESRST